ncbi:hypothetical protein J6590_067807 [Homalodisca vitripennis]|nr:hypothetical protein J6590_067807 [Homalodisca vitripennis]
MSRRDHQLISCLPPEVLFVCKHAAASSAPRHTAWREGQSSFSYYPDIGMMRVEYGAYVTLRCRFVSKLHILDEKKVGYVFVSFGLLPNRYNRIVEIQSSETDANLSLACKVPADHRVPGPWKRGGVAAARRTKAR